MCLKTILSIFVAFIIPVIISLIIYFVVLKPNLCGNGRNLYDCSGSDVSICVDGSVDYKDYCGTKQ